MRDSLLNPHLERYHSIYDGYQHLTTKQINTFSLCSHLTDSVAEVHSTDYSGVIIPAVRTLEEAIRTAFQSSRRKTRTLGAFVHHYRRDPDKYNALCDNVNYPDHLLDRASLMVILKYLATYRGQAGHAYISRKTVGRCLSWSAMIVNILNTIPPPPKDDTDALDMVDELEAVTA